MPCYASSRFSLLASRFSLGKRSAKAGFTLTELLVALAILGVIASIMIPKVIADISEKQVHAILKTNIAAVNSVVVDAWQGNTYTNMTDVLTRKLNYSSYCAANDVSGPCADAYWRPSVMAINKVRLIMPDGAIIWPNYENDHNKHRIVMKAIQNNLPDPRGVTAISLAFNPTDQVLAASDDNPELKPGQLLPRTLDGYPALYAKVFE